MISLSGKVKVLEKLAIDNSPVLLTAIGVAGTIGTALLTHKAATKAERIIYAEESVSGTAGDRHKRIKERSKLVWKLYIPPVLSGTATVGAIVLANHIGTKRAAALAAAYTISEKAYSEYREKVVERLGDKDEKELRNSIAQDRVRKMPPSDGNVLMIGGGDHLFLEMFTGRYFRSDIESIRKAVNEINYKINTFGSACQSDFYDLVGLPRTSVSDSVGWNQDKLMDVNYEAVLSEDGQPCVAINFMSGPSPVRDYSRFH